MTSTLLIKILLVEYAVIMAVCLWEKRWAMGGYWASALALNYFVLVGMK